jgi:hypothetical protein
MRTVCGRKPQMDRPQITIGKITAFPKTRTMRTVRTQISLPPIRSETSETKPDFQGPETADSPAIVSDVSDVLLAGDDRGDEEVF